MFIGYPSQPVIDNSNVDHSQDPSLNGEAESDKENKLKETFESPEKLNAEQVPFEDLESLFVK